RADRDLGGITQGFGVSRDTLRRVIARNGNPRTRGNGTSEAVDRQNGRTSRQVATVDRTRQDVASTSGDRGIVLAHEDIIAELATERSFPQRRAVITDLIGRGESRILEESGFAVRSQDQVTTFDVSLLEVLLVAN